MKTNYLDRMTDIANAAIDYIENQKEEIIFPKNYQPRITVMVEDSYLLNRELDTETIVVERYDDGIVYTTDGREIDLAKVDIYGFAKLADAISELKENINKNKE